MTGDAERDALLAANAGFYAAFAAANFATMDELWARQAPVACVHPGWQPLVGREAVMRSWANMFTSGQTAAVVCRNPAARIVGDAGLVLCLEVLPHALLAATNCYVREAGHWRLIHHHAGPVGQAIPAPSAANKNRRLH